MTTELSTPISAIEAKQNVLVKDIKITAGDTDALLREITGAATDSYVATCVKVEGKLSDAKARFNATRTRIPASAQRFADTGYAYAKETPWKIAGATAIVGLVVGYLLRRS